MNEALELMPEPVEDLPIPGGHSLAWLEQCLRSWDLAAAADFTIECSCRDGSRVEVFTIECSYRDGTRVEVSRVERQGRKNQTTG